MIDYRAMLRVFDLDTIPSIDIAALGALQLVQQDQIPKLDFSHLKRPLVLGSGNAFFTAQILFDGVDVHFADESTYLAELRSPGRYDGAVVLSASGKKHAISMVKESQKAHLDAYLITSTPESDASVSLDEDHIFVFPKNREPYTYNTSTYLSPIFGKTEENPATLSTFIEKELSTQLLRNFEDYEAYSFIIPSRFKYARAMLRTKFDELFGPMVVGRVFTDEEVKHAKTVVESGRELFISFGITNEHYGLGRNRLHLSLPEDVQYGGFLAISYYVVGKIQESHPPYFARSVAKYTRVASDIFDQEINPIVE